MSATLFKHYFLVCFIISTAFASHSQGIKGEYFDDNSNGWSLNDGVKIEDGKLQMRDNQSYVKNNWWAVNTFDFDHNQDCTISIDMKLISWDRGAPKIVFGGKGSNDYYKLSFGFGDVFDIDKISNGKTIPQIHSSQRLPYKLKIGRSYTFDIQKVGNRLIFYMNEEKMWELKDAPLMGGLIGMIYAGEMEVHVDRISIEQNGIESAPTNGNIQVVTAPLPPILYLENFQAKNLSTKGSKITKNASMLLSLDIENTGEGTAESVEVSVTCSSPDVLLKGGSLTEQGEFVHSKIKINAIPPKKKQTVYFNFQASEEALITNGVSFEISVTESQGKYGLNRLRRVEYEATDRSNNQPSLTTDGRGDHPDVIAEIPEAVIGEYHALLIGVNDYQHLRKLNEPIKDVEALKYTLTSFYNFSPNNVTVLHNATRSDIIRALTDLKLRVRKNDNVLIYYAGHGIYDRDEGNGYWQPIDAEEMYTDNWISNHRIQKAINSYDNKHTILISDACFSGSFFRGSNMTEKDLPVQKLFNLRARVAITSGTKEQVVPDDSQFHEKLIIKLNQNEKSYLSASDLFIQIRNELDQTAHTPMNGYMQDVGHEGGDFIFIKK